jgi:hypothetical protein
MTAEPEREVSQDEKRAVLANDISVRQQQKPTFHSFAQAEADTPRGRFTTVEKATVIGVGPPSYPKGPDWTVDPVGPEPNLGFDVNAMQPTGEAFEVRRLIEANLPPPEFSPSPSRGVFGDPTALCQPSSSSDVQRVGSPSFSKNKGNNDD